MSEQIKFKSIGVVRTNATPDEVRASSHNIASTITVYDEFGDALDGIDGHSHIYVLAHFNALRADQIGHLKVRPRRLLRRGLKLEELPFLGVFALDSPTRPNPIGLSLVKLVRREGNILHVTGLDYFDGTPIIDLKPYHPEHIVTDFSVPDWYTELERKAGHI